MGFKILGPICFSVLALSGTIRAGVVDFPPCTSGFVKWNCNTQSIAANYPPLGAVWAGLAQTFTAQDPSALFGFYVVNPSAAAITDTTVIFSLWTEIYPAGGFTYYLAQASAKVTLPSRAEGLLQVSFASISLIPGAQYQVVISLPVPECLGVFCLALPVTGEPGVYDPFGNGSAYSVLSVEVNSLTGNSYSGGQSYIVPGSFPATTSELSVGYGLAFNVTPTGTGATQQTAFQPLCSICTIPGPPGTNYFVYQQVQVPSGSWFDPASASAFEYTMTSGSLFTSILNFPTGFANPFTVSTDGVVLGTFSPGQGLIFPNGGVSDFTISGISPLVDPSNLSSFPLQLAFNTPTASFTQQTPPVVSPSQVSTTASGLAYSRVTQTFNGTVTLRNISSSAISGPLQILFTGMPAGVTLVNATSSLSGTLSGTPYLTVPAVTNLSPGQSVTISVRFKNPSNATINFTPAIYSGSFN